MGRDRFSEAGRRARSCARRKQPVYGAQLEDLAENERNRAEPDGEDPAGRGRRFQPQNMGEIGQVRGAENKHDTEPERRPDIGIAGDLVAQQAGCRIAHVEDMPELRQGKRQEGDGYGGGW